ncbi:MAG: hypothetical protein COA66_07035 [Arcobacter sp.]|nr:MAG: hypothetical protein COA66_07035 [Arcobacter sp.]
MTTSIIITFVIGLLDFTVTDASLSARYSNAHRYFDDFSLKNVFLPFINTHRLEAEGSLHNELLEIFSFFGFVIIYYYYLLRNMFCNVKNEYKLISYLLMFIILTGALIQINISNPYVGIMLGCTLAIITHSKKE